MENTKHSLLKVLGLLLSVYLTLFIALVVPLHHHDDCGQHDDCAICAVAHQPFVLNASIVIVVSLVCCFVTILPLLQSFKKDTTHLYLRSPPAL